MMDLSGDELLAQQAAAWQTLSLSPVWRPIDRELAQFLLRLNRRLGGADEPALALCIALLSHELGEGDVCLALARIPERLATLGVQDGLESLGDLQDLAARLRALPLVSDGRDGQALPLVLDDDRLYLARYHAFETQVADWLRQACQPQCSPLVDPASLATSLDRLFHPEPSALLYAWRQTSGTAEACAAFARQWLDVRDEEPLDWSALAELLNSSEESSVLASLAAWLPASACFNGQKLAVAPACSGRFTLISGGPGTGKTTTVARLLALLQQQALSRDDGEPLLIRLAAPTGKAAARLTESLGRALDELQERLGSELLAHLPRQASTLHRLLGVIPGSHEFRHHTNNPLALDLLVVDEASMVDLPMMARLLAALPPSARLILLGDKDQLASVEAGAVLGDICALLSAPLTQEQRSWLQAVTSYELSVEGEGEAHPVRDRLCWLQKSWRFHAGSGIGQLAAAVNRGDGRALTRLFGGDYPDIALHEGDERRALLLQRVSEGYADYLRLVQAPVDETAVRAVLQAFNRLRVLCALREGEWGVAGLNGAIQTALMRQGWLQVEGEWYVGRPVMIVRNDHALGLYNGDIGIAAHDGERLRVWFELPDGQVRGFLPSRLPEHETAFALTVHKSQGSEFAHTLLVLPDQDNPVLTRELLYTGITRAKQRLDLFAPLPLLQRTIAKCTQRSSGLTRMLLRP